MLPDVTTRGARLVVNLDSHEQRIASSRLAPLPEPHPALPRSASLRILVDECLPEDLVGWLPEWDVRMVQRMGRAVVKNGELLRRAEREFDLF